MCASTHRLLTVKIMAPPRRFRPRCVSPGGVLIAYFVEPVLERVEHDYLRRFIGDAMQGFDGGKADSIGIAAVKHFIRSIVFAELAKLLRINLSKSDRGYHFCSPHRDIGRRAGTKNRCPFARSIYTLHRGSCKTLS